MARPAKKVEEKKFDIEQNEKDLQHMWNERVQDELNEIKEKNTLLNWLEDTVIDLIEKVEVLEKKVEKPEGKSIHKIEAYTGEQPPTAESYNGMKMGASDRIISMQNAIKILPPNMIVNGRHRRENVEAIVGFKVSDEMMDEAYEGLENDPRGN